MLKRWDPNSDLLCGTIDVFGIRKEIGSPERLAKITPVVSHNGRNFALNLELLEY